MPTIDYATNRRFTLTASVVTTLEFGNYNSRVIDIVNLSSFYDVMIREDGDATISAMSYKLLPGMSVYFAKDLKTIQFYSTGAAEVQVIDHGRKQ